MDTTFLNRNEGHNRRTSGCSKLKVRKHDNFRESIATLEHKQVPNLIGTGIWANERPLYDSHKHPLQIFHGNLSEFGIKVKVGNKVQFGIKVIRLPYIKV